MGSEMCIRDRHILDICHMRIPGDHAVCQQILSPTARMHDARMNPVGTSRSSISYRLLYGPATGLSNLRVLDVFVACYGHC